MGGPPCLCVKWPRRTSGRVTRALTSSPIRSGFVAQSALRSAVPHMRNVGCQTKKDLECARSRLSVPQQREFIDSWSSIAAKAFIHSFTAASKTARVRLLRDGGRCVRIDGRTLPCLRFGLDGNPRPPAGVPARLDRAHSKERRRHIWTAFARLVRHALRAVCPANKAPAQGFPGSEPRCARPFCQESHPRLDVVDTSLESLTTTRLCGRRRCGHRWMLRDPHQFGADLVLCGE